MQALADIEARYPVAQWTVAGIPVWPLARVRWSLGEWAAHYAAPSAAGRGGRALSMALRILAGPARAALAQLRDFAHRPRGPARRDLLFLSDGMSYARLGGQWLERFCDPVIGAASARKLTSSLLSPLHEFRLPRATPSRFIQPKLDRANLAGAARTAISPNAACLPAIDDVCERVRALGFGAAPLAPKKVLSDGLRLRALANLHARCLRATQPRLAFVVSYYGIEGMAFVLACREAGVPVVDIQHGVQGEMHPAYAAWPHATHALLPDRFWVWSAWERDVIQRWAHGTGHRAVLGGNPWLSIWEDASAWPGVADATTRADALAARAAGRPAVLVTLQYGLKPAEQLAPLRELLRASGQSLRFWVRLHPSMLERREEVRAFLAGAPCVELDEPTDLPLQALLPRAAVHLTHSSSTVIEAAQFGVRTVITSAFGAELFGPLQASGWAVLETGSARSVLARLAELAARRSAAGAASTRIGEALDELLA